MAKFLDDTGLSHLWDKIKSKFYTKTETDTLLGNKQDTLTPGTNITISGTTISATDTNTHRPITVNGTGFLGNNTTTLNFVTGSNILLSPSNGSLTISASDTKPHDLIVDSSPAAVNVDSSTSWKIIASFTGLDRDSLYLVSVAIQWQSNATGFRGIGISNSVSSADPMGIIFQNTVAAANGAATNMTMTTFFTPTNGEISLVGRQNSGSSKTCTYRYRFIKLT